VTQLALQIRRFHAQNPTSLTSLRPDFMYTNVPAQDIKIGMFIAELDRPWTDTPFLLQGFLVEDAQQVAQLQSCCKFVYVDRERSAAGVLPQVREPDPPPRAAASPAAKPRRPSGNAAPASGRARELSDSEALILDVIEELGPGTETDYRSSLTPGEITQTGLFGSLLEGIGGLFRKRKSLRMPERETVMTKGRLDDVDKAPRTPVHHDFIPRSIAVTFHPETKTIEEELTPAKKAIAQVEALSRQVVDDIRAGRGISVEELDQVLNDVVDSVVRSPDALVWVARLKQQDAAIYGHSLQAAVYLLAFGRHLGLPKEQLAQLAVLGLFFDLGKTKVLRTLLSKPGPLTPDEFNLVKQHVSLGMDLIRQFPGLHPAILEGVAQHHEREDGSGYPAGLRAEGISLFGRMAGIVDTFVALTNPRPHQAAVSSYEALRKLAGWAGTLFHDPMVEQFIQTVGLFPVGCLVELSSGEIAVVVRQSKVRRLKPKLLVITGPDKVPIQSPAILDLLYQSDSNEPVHIVRGLPAGFHGLDARDYNLPE
jgi:HD-GYP domain-containing protein (c-di-GMP phosphodiesterase class II)